MKLGIITDCHANLEAMEVVWAKGDELGVDKWVCLGDMVGYNADPGPVLDQVREKCDAVLAGNHERYQFGEVPDVARDEARESAEYTRKQLTDEQQRYIQGLPEQELYKGAILLVHGSVRDPDEYIRETSAMVGNLKRLKKEYVGVDLCLYGHTHLPMAVAQGVMQSKFTDEENVIQLQGGKPHLVNVGSVGQPRDRDSRCAFGVFDVTARTITVYRLEYDVDTTMDKVRKAGLPAFLADRLKEGR